MRALEEIIEEYENTRQSFKNFTSVGDANKDALLEYQQRFLDLKADLRPWHTKMMHAAEMRSDKSATAIKMRIAVAMVKDEFTFEENEKLQNMFFRMIGQCDGNKTKTGRAEEDAENLENI